MFKDMMWKAAKATNVPYHEASMQKIKNVSVDAYDALARLDRKKWTRLVDEQKKKMKIKGIVGPNVSKPFLEPLRGPTFWRKIPYPDILPPELCVLLGRPKKCRQKDETELREIAEKQAFERAKKEKADGVIKVSRKGNVIHCKICGAPAHNTRTCPLRSDMERQRQAGQFSSQPTPVSEIDAIPSRPQPQTQPPTNSAT
ncbi:hypothetical protein LIER_36521 [Lithospermum erythrorhizon]|uniref:Uncharacterized protein n=1 Tax=Lithospermum erythrorhizon TaxID=34254 RepID=A0AAV3P7A4_LITER